MSTTLITIAQSDALAATRRAVAPVAAAVTATDLKTRGTAASAGTWSIAIRKPMSDVDFHDRWPLRSTL